MEASGLDEGYTLPWDWYVSPDVLRLEQERIFRRTWHYAGPAAWAERPGDYFACRAADMPVVVARDRAGGLRAFVNVCRHRGAVVVEGRGHRETLQCGYHAWTYDLDGSLRAAPRSEREPAFDRSELSLRPALVDTWGPFVFVNADLDAAPLADALGRLPALMTDSRIDLDALVFRERVEYQLEANWKIAVENYLECYHCPVAHPGFSRLVDVDSDAWALAAHDGFWSQFGRRREPGEGPDTCEFHLVWPSLKLNVYPGFANLSIGPVYPAGPERTAGFLDYFFGPDVSEKDARELIGFDDQVGREDIALVESVQRGVRSGVLERGRLLLGSEHLIQSFQQRVAVALCG